MRLKAIGIIGLLTLFIVSCQKEIDWGTNSADQLLVKIQSTTGSDSTVITYAYDGSRRLIGETTVGVSAGVTLDGTFVINRDASGVITSTVQKSALLLSAGVDSIKTRYYYNSGTQHYTAAAFDISIAGFNVTDSAVYTYDGNSRITSDLHSIISGIFPPFAALKNQYTYSANGSNLTKTNQLGTTIPFNPLTDISNQTNTFDTKTDPLILKNEAILLGRLGFYNANNVTKNVFVNATDPTQNFTMDYTYKYNVAGKPDSSYSTRTPGGNLTASKYFYQ